MEQFVQLEKFFHFSLDETSHWNPGPTTDDGGDIFFVHLFLQQTGFVLLFAKRLLLEFKFPLQPGQFAVPQFRHFVQIVGAFGAFDVLFHLFYLLANLPQLAHRIFFGFPSSLKGLQVAILFVQFFFNRLETRLAACIGFFFEGFPLDLQLQDFPGDFIKFRGQTVDFCTEPRGGFVDEIDRLVRQKPIADVPV